MIGVVFETVNIVQQERARQKAHFERQYMRYCKVCYDVGIHAVSREVFRAAQKDYNNERT